MGALVRNLPISNGHMRRMLRTTQRHNGCQWVCTKAARSASTVAKRRERDLHWRRLYENVAVTFADPFNLDYGTVVQDMSVPLSVTSTG